MGWISAERFADSDCGGGSLRGSFASPELPQRTRRASRFWLLMVLRSIARLGSLGFLEMFCCLEVFCRCKPLSCPSGPCVLMEFVDLSYSPEGPLLILFDQVCHIREEPRDRSRKEFRAAVAEVQPAAALSPLTMCQISLERSGGAVVAKRAVPSHATVDPSGDSEAVVEDSPASSGPGGECFASGLVKDLEPHFGAEDWSLSRRCGNLVSRTETFRWKYFGSSLDVFLRTFCVLRPRG